MSQISRRSDRAEAARNLAKHRREKLIKIGLPLLAVTAVFVGTIYFLSTRQRPMGPADVSNLLGSSILANAYPQELEMTLEDESVRTRIMYYLDNEITERVQGVLKQYRPDYAAFVAMDAETGEIISIANYTKKADERNHTLRATFPAASVFKVITAAAAIDRKKVSSETVIPFNGRSNTLYRKNVHSDKTNRWTRYMTLRDAFARSVNTVFGKLGLFYVGPSDLFEYAKRFGFNSQIETDMPFELGTTTIPEDDSEAWKVTEVASGFTLDNRLSPLHGAMIAAAVANDGVLMVPRLVKQLQSAEGETLYTSKPTVIGESIDPTTAGELKSMMMETVKTGTSRGSFRTFFNRRKYRDIEVGGKTGSLTGDNPQGKCDWFVGYAKLKNRKIAFAALTVHEKYWTVKSAYVARKFIEFLADKK